MDARPGSLLSCPVRQQWIKDVDLQEGEVVKVKVSTVKVCEDGKIRTKHKSEVPQPLMLACGGENYNTVVLQHSCTAERQNMSVCLYVSMSVCL